MARLLLLSALLTVPVLGSEPEYPVIKLDREACADNGPEYELSVFADGKVEYKGHRRVPIEGSLKFRVPRSDVEALVTRCNSSTFLDADSVHAGGTLHIFFLPYDSRCIELTCGSGGRGGRTWDTGSEPRALTDLEVAIESIANPVANIKVMSDWISSHPDLSSPEGGLAVQSAAASNAPRVLQFLVDHGAKLQGTDVLKVAIMADCVDCVPVIQHGGIDLNLPGPDGELPIVSAAARGRELMLSTLLSAGARLSLQSKLSENGLPASLQQSTVTPLMAAAFCIPAGPREWPRFSREQMASINKDRAASHGPERQECIAVVSEILKHHADVNQANSEGVTALMLAVDSDSEDTVRMLIQAGAEIATRDKRGRSAIDRAEGYPEILQLLQKHGGLPTLCRFQRWGTRTPARRVAHAFDFGV